MQQLARDGMTTVAVMESTSFARDVADRVVCSMDGGMIVEEGKP